MATKEKPELAVSVDAETMAIGCCSKTLGLLSPAQAARVITHLAQKHIPNAGGISLYGPDHPLYQSPAPRAGGEEDDDGE